MELKKNTESGRWKKKKKKKEEEGQELNNLKFQYCCGVNVLIVWSEGGVAYRMPIH